MTKCQLTQWIDLDNEKQVRWAFLYLARKQNLHHPILSSYLEIDFNSMRHEVLRFKNELLNDLDNKAFISKMRDAWRQERYRQTSKSKSKEQYSFVLSKAASKKLTQLAKKIEQPRNHTLDLLISGSYSDIEAKRNRVKEEKAAIKRNRKHNQFVKEAFDLMPQENLDKVIEERDSLKEKCDQLTHELDQLRAT